ncbi:MULTISPECIES: hypothetical protein [unclassified Burkholderia]|nr:MULTISPECIES: hypothetical protein [unclassified Burkholderia]
MNPSVISAHAEAIDALSLSTCVAMVMFALGKPRVGAVALFSIAALPFRMELAAPHGAAPPTCRITMRRAQRANEVDSCCVPFLSVPWGVQPGRAEPSS